MADQGLYWLASYPKSGNTWARAVIANLQNEAQADINSLSTGNIASSRGWIENALGFDVDELSHDEIDELRSIAYRWHAEQEGSGKKYHKTHDAYTYLPNGEALIPKEAVRGAVYMVRNPLDIVPSWANHQAISLDEAIDTLCDSNHALSGSISCGYRYFRQRLLSWGEHVESWLRADIRRLLIRYEDLYKDPLSYFSKLAGFLNIEAAPDQIRLAIERSRFAVLQSQEIDHGFWEKRFGVELFFRKGIVGDWRSCLSQSQIDRIIGVNHESMRLLGYLDDDGGPVVFPHGIKEYGE